MVCPAFCMFHNVSPSLPVIRPSATCIQEGHFHLLHWSILIGNTKQVLQPRSLPGWPVCLGFPWWWTKWAKNNISSINTRTWIWYWFIEAKILYNGLHLTVNLLIWTIVNMFSDKFWHFSQVHGATPLGRLLSGRQQLARHASLCGLNVKSSVRCCSQPFQLVQSAPCVFMAAWQETSMLSLNLGTIYTRSLVLVFRENISPFSQLGRDEQAFTLSDHPPMHSHGAKQNIKKTHPQGLNIIWSSNQETVQVLSTKNLQYIQ